MSVCVYVCLCVHDACLNLYVVTTYLVLFQGLGSV